MITSEEGINFILTHEGCKLEAYPDPATGGEPWTIGVGHTGGVAPGDTCTEDEAREWLRRDVQTSERCVNASVKGNITQNAFDALTSFVFNLGCGALGKSTLLKLVNDGEDVKAADEFLKWTHANGRIMAGLVTRRRDERELFLT